MFSWVSSQKKKKIIKFPYKISPFECQSEKRKSKTKNGCSVNKQPNAADFSPDKEELEEKWKKLEAEKEEHESRIQSLANEIKLLQEDNKSLEETALSSQRKLEEEKKELEAKKNFLHFTQEQLNNELTLKDELIKLLQTETDKLKEEVRSSFLDIKNFNVSLEILFQLAALNHELQEEKERMVDLENVYAKENEETLEEFQK
jgi:chromosome segregation ATPase